MCHRLYQPPLPFNSTHRVDLKNDTKKNIEINFFMSEFLQVCWCCSLKVSHRRLDLCIENQAAIVSWKLAPISQSGHLCPNP